MTLMIDMTPELEDRLQNEAARFGVAVEDYARKLLEERLLDGPRTAAQAKITPQERKRRLSLWIESNRGLPMLPEEALQRASFYGERG